MFPARYYNARMFPARYFPKIGAFFGEVQARIMVLPAVSYRFVVPAAIRRIVVPEE